MASLIEPALAVRAIETPIGALTVVASAQGVREVRWGGRAGDGVGVAGTAAGEHLERAVAELAAYFAGERRSFDLPLDLQGTEFQRAVWEELSRIPFAETRSYGEIAQAVGRAAGAARAVGAATGRNPAPIIVPCHRVVGAGGALTGFAGGIETKRALLAHEAEVAGEKREGRLPGF